MIEVKKADARGKHMLVKVVWFWQLLETPLGCVLRSKMPDRLPRGVTAYEGDHDCVARVWMPLPAPDPSRGLDVPDLREIFQ